MLNDKGEEKAPQKGFIKQILSVGHSNKQNIIQRLYTIYLQRSKLSAITLLTKATMLKEIEITARQKVHLASQDSTVETIPIPL